MSGVREKVVSLHYESITNSKFNNKMKKYDSTMYPSLSAYVLEHAEQIIDTEDVRGFFEYLKKPGARFSYDYAGPFGDTGHQSVFDLIEKPMEAWFAENDIDYDVFFKETTANHQWMVCDIPDTYAFLFKELLHDLAEKQGIL